MDRSRRERPEQRGRYRDADYRPARRCPESISKSESGFQLCRRVGLVAPRQWRHVKETRRKGLTTGKTKAHAWFSNQTRSFRRKVAFAWTRSPSAAWTILERPQSLKPRPERNSFISEKSHAPA